MVDINYAPTPDIKPFSFEESNFDIWQSAIEEDIDGVPVTPYVDEDRNMTTETGTTITQNAQVGTSRICSYRSTKPNVATVDANGKVTWQSDGEVRIIADGPRASKGVVCNVSQLTGQTSNSLVDYVNGSFAKHACDQIDAKIAGKDLSHAPLFTSFDPWIRNPNCWAADIDLSPLNTINETYYTNSAPTLVSPRHFLQANHYPVSVGAWVEYVASDGTNRVCRRTVVASQRVYESVANGTTLDMQLGVLDSDVDDFISFCKILPINWQEYLPSISAPFPLFYAVPILMVDKNKQAYVFNFFQEFASQNTYPVPYTYWYAQSTQPTEGQRAVFAHYLIGGDSGSAGSIILNNKLVYIMPIGGGAGSGPSVVRYTSQINSLMTSMGNNPNNYQLTMCDLSTFNVYP